MSASPRTFLADLSGLVVRFHGLDDALADKLAESWAPFAAPGDAAPWLDVEVKAWPHTIATEHLMRPSVTGDIEDGGARFRSDEGEIDLEASGRAHLRIGSGDVRWRFWGLVNLVTAAAAVHLPSRSGALLHAAGIVVDGRAFLLIGPEGAGKSTFALTAREGGAEVISDDAVILDGARGRLELLGSPMRAHEATQLGPGRWPVAAILHARRGSPARLDPVSRLAVEAVVTANLPFLASGWGRDPRLDALVRFLAGVVPHRALTFAPDPAFLKILRAFALLS